MTRGKKFKSSLMIFLECLKRPLKVSAFGVFPINLETFLNIFNMAYSLLTLLKSMKDE
jgi:hypothetical protein